MSSKASIVALAIAAASVATGEADAQSYPTKVIRLIVPFAPGGGTDIMARVIMPRLEERLKQRILIENRVGGGGYIAAERHRGLEQGWSVRQLEALRAIIEA